MTESIEATLSNEEKHVLKALEATGEAPPEDVLEASGLEELVEVMNAASWLEAKGLVRTTEELKRLYRLTEEGQRCAREGLPERRALRVLEEAGGDAPMEALTTSDALEPHERGAAIGQLREKGLIEIDEGRVRLTSDGHTALEAPLPEEPVLDALEGGEKDAAYLASVDEEGLKRFKQRGQLFTKRDKPLRRVQLTGKGQDLVDTAELSITEQIAQLSPEHLKTGAWKEATLRPYDVKAFAPAAYPGKRHPMQDIIEKIRRIFLAMGFHEIAGDHARTAFWNLDALFIPQDHPAREMQDTFYLEDPAQVALDDEEGFVSAVKAAHEHGADTGSTGWQYAWSEEEASRVLLRTHTTVDTIKHLAEDPAAPQRVFEIGRVFRKERVDATHLPEFHQVEGIVVEEEATLDMLIGLLRAFYDKMGFEDVRVRPAYFPYTEPSLEVDVYYNDEWLELGGAGIFRPEVTEPLGVEHPVLAWGLGLERLAMTILELDDIRELYMSDVDWLRTTRMLW